ncbi:MAG: 4Fe-4S binding protein [Candidatus Nanoarchaeia archaeon]|nr:4Fe-4S binding protein [Candidatus Nanoarchaeia archaeon]
MKLKGAKEIEIGGSLESGTSKEYKTGNWKTFKPKVDFNKCIQCMRCVMFCPDICIAAKNGKRLETNFDFCKGCGICAEVCPVKCIKMVKDE